MSGWTRESAEQELRGLIDEIATLADKRRFSAEHTKWLTRSLRCLEQVFGQASRYYLSLADLEWQETGHMVFDDGSRNLEGQIEGRHQESYVHDLDTAKGLLEAAVEELERVGLDGVYEGKDTGPESSALVKILTIVERKLRKAIRDEPSKEKDVQEALDTLFMATDCDLSRETDSIEYSSKTYVPDFTFQRLDLALEVKLCPREGREKEMIAEINDDILAYKTKVWQCHLCCL